MVTGSIGSNAGIDVVVVITSYELIRCLNRKGTDAFTNFAPTNNVKDVTTRVFKFTCFEFFSDDGHKCDHNSLTIGIFISPSLLDCGLILLF